MAFETHGDDFKPCASWLDAVWYYGWYGVKVKLDDAFSGAIDIDGTESVNGEQIWLTNQFSEKRKIEFKELKYVPITIIAWKQGLSRTDQLSIA